MSTIRYSQYINACRYLVMAGAAGGTLLGLPYGRYPVFFLCMLLLLMNTQLRLLLGRRGFFIASVLVDAIMVLYISSVFSVFSSLMLVVTLTDILLKLKSDAYPLLGVVTIAFGYVLWHAGNLEPGAVMALFYVVALLLLLHLRKELSSKTEVETLYDQLRRSNYELEAAQARLVDYSRQVEKVTKLEERNRISRELHDSIGHNLTGILMQVDAAIQVLEVNRDKGMELLQSVYRNINSSIEALRDTVKRLRPAGYQSHHTTIAELISKFTGTTGAQVEYSTTGIPYELFPSIETVLYRNIQEALTNAVRHGRADRIRVQVYFRPEAVEAVISDNGSGCSEIKKGFGLCGMEERLELIGGQIDYRSEKGFTLRMEIPTNTAQGARQL